MIFLCKLWNFPPSFNFWLNSCLSWWTSIYQWWKLRILRLNKFYNLTNYFDDVFSYIFPKAMASCLFKMSLVTPLIPIEDLFVTGIVGGKCGFSRKDVPGFYVNRIDPCGPDAEIVLLHGVEPEEQHLLQELMLIKRFYRKCRWTWWPEVNRKKMARVQFCSDI